MYSISPVVLAILSFAPCVAQFTDQVCFAESECLGSSPVGFRCLHNFSEENSDPHSKFCYRPEARLDLRFSFDVSDCAVEKPLQEGFEEGLVKLLNISDLEPQIVAGCGSFRSRRLAEVKAPGVLNLDLDIASGGHTVVDVAAKVKTEHDNLQEHIRKFLPGNYDLVGSDFALNTQCTQKFCDTQGPEWKLQSSKANVDCSIKSGTCKTECCEEIMCNADNRNKTDSCDAAEGAIALTDNDFASAKCTYHQCYADAMFKNDPGCCTRKKACWHHFKTTKSNVSSQIAVACAEGDTVAFDYCADASCTNTGGADKATCCVKPKLAYDPLQVALAGTFVVKESDCTGFVASASGLLAVEALITSFAKKIGVPRRFVKLREFSCSPKCSTAFEAKDGVDSQKFKCSGDANDVDGEKLCAKGACVNADKKVCCNSEKLKPQACSAAFQAKDGGDNEKFECNNTLNSANCADDPCTEAEKTTCCTDGKLKGDTRRLEFAGVSGVKAVAFPDSILNSAKPDAWSPGFSASVGLYIEDEKAVARSLAVAGESFRVGSKGVLTVTSVSGAQYSDSYKHL